MHIIFILFVPASHFLSFSYENDYGEGFFPDVAVYFPPLNKYIKLSQNIECTVMKKILTQIWWQKQTSTSSYLCLEATCYFFF